MSLRLKCKALQEYTEFFQRNLFRCDGDTEPAPYDDEYDHPPLRESLSQQYMDMLTTWEDIDIGSSHIRKCTVEDGVTTIFIKKKVTTHTRGSSLHQDYVAFLHDVVVPATSEIWDCVFESDDCGDLVQTYTDSELRRRPFRLSSIIRSVEHMRRDDTGDIYETRITYKRGMSARLYEIDLTRAYMA